MRPVDLRRLVAETRGMLAHVLPKAVAIECVAEGETPPVVADPNEAPGYVRSVNRPVDAFCCSRSRPDVPARFEVMRILFTP